MILNERSLYNEGLTLKSFHLSRVENRWHFRHRVPTLSMHEGADTLTAISRLSSGRFPQVKIGSYVVKATPGSLRIYLPEPFNNLSLSDAPPSIYGRLRFDTDCAPALRFRSARACLARRAASALNWAALRAAWVFACLD